MDQSIFIAGQFATQNSRPLNATLSEDAFYDRFGTDHFAGLKHIWSALRNRLSRLVDGHRPTKTTVVQRA